jgi:cytochrome c-type biogenesis protein CcmH
MSGYFWVATIVMATVAFAFVGLPLLKNGRRSSVLASAIALPVFAAGLYWSLGTPAAAGGVPFTGDATQMTRGSSATPVSQPVGTVASMVEGLAKRLESNPEDGASWLLLAKSYKHLGLIPDAIAAYSRAAALGKTDADLAALSGIQTPIIQ